MQMTDFQFSGTGTVLPEKYWQNTRDNIAINFIKMLRLGPLVSFNGSPTVSPITAALWG